MNTVSAELKRLHSPDVDRLDEFAPRGEFGILLQMMVGPSNGVGDEAFDIVVCTPGWFANNMRTGIVSGRHHIFVRRFDFELLKKYLHDYCSTCSGPSWAAVAEKVGRIGKWEFEDYRA